MEKKDLSAYLDLANHRPQSTPEDIRELCLKVKKYGFHAAFVNPYYVRLAKEAMGDEGAVGAVVSFPLGQETKDTKILAAIGAVRNGADELDVSMNVGLFLGNEKNKVLDEMRSVVCAVKEIKKSAVVKFIIETGLLTPDQIKEASELVLQSGADFVKTCSGMGPRGASLEDIRLIKEAIGDKIKIKVAGGIDTLKEAIDFINGGAARIGTSHAVEIIEEWERNAAG